MENEFIKMKQTLDEELEIQLAFRKHKKCGLCKHISVLDQQVGRYFCTFCNFTER